MKEADEAQVLALDLAELVLGQRRCVRGSQVEGQVDQTDLPGAHEVDELRRTHGGALAGEGVAQNHTEFVLGGGRHDVFFNTWSHFFPPHLNAPPFLFFHFPTCVQMGEIFRFG